MSGVRTPRRPHPFAGGSSATFSARRAPASRRSRRWPQAYAPTSAAGSTSFAMSQQQQPKQPSTTLSRPTSLYANLVFAPLADGSADAAHAVGSGKRLAPSLVAVHCAGIATDEAKIAHLRASGLFHDD